VTRTSWQKLEHDVVLNVRLTKGWRPTADRYGISVAKVKRIVKNNARREREARSTRLENRVLPTKKKVNYD
jgi:hypothetical protein